MSITRILPGLLVISLLFGFTDGVDARTLIVDNGHTEASDDNPGSEEQPLLTIGAAARQAQAGDTVLVRPGHYRESVVIANSGKEGAPIVFQSEEPHAAIVSGSDVLTEWQEAEAGVWHAPMEGVSEVPHNPGNAEWVYVNGFPLLKAYERGELRPGMFYQDFENERLYVAPEEHHDIDEITVEFAHRQGLFRGVAWHDHNHPDADWHDYIHIKGFTIEHDASWFRSVHAIRFLGRGWLIEGNHIRWISSRAISGFGNEIEVRDNLIEWAGQLALGGSGANFHYENNRVFYSNWIPIDPWGEGGSSKFALLIDGVFRGNHCAYAYGSGIWFDGRASGNLVENNLSHDIIGAGFFTEIDLPGQVFAGNVSFNNHEGVNVAETPGTLVRRNVVFNNRQGIRMRGSYSRQWGGMHQRRELRESERRWIASLKRVGVSSHRAKRLEADIFIYYYAPHALMTNNNAIWENLGFDNDTNYFEHRNYGAAAPTDPFVNNLSNHNIWYAEDSGSHFAHGGGRYGGLDEWQEVSGRDGDSVIINPHEEADELPEWARAHREYWQDEMLGHAALVDLDLRLTDSATALVAMARIRRSPVIERVELPGIQAYVIKVEGERTLAMWLPAGEGSRRDADRNTRTLDRQVVRLAMDVDQVEVENGYLGTEQRELDAGVLDLAVTWVPVYIRNVGEFEPLD